MVKQSNVDIAYDIVSANGSPITFADLWAKLCEVNNYTEQEATRKIGSFYTSLLLDGRFVNLGDNTWDLRSRYKFDKVTLDVNECYSEEDEVEQDQEEKEDENDSSDDEASDEEKEDDYVE